jgi:Ni/Co efflux regulator RcnB
MSENVEDVDKAFDKAERVWDRFQKLLLKIVGGVVGISLAVYVAYDQLKDKHKETIGGHTTEQVDSEIPESTTEHKEKYVITKKTFIVDTYNYRKGDTVYVDYYDDGFIDKYYKSDGKIYYEKD